MPLSSNPLEVLNDKKTIDIKARTKWADGSDKSPNCGAPQTQRGASSSTQAHDRQRHLGGSGMRRHARKKRKTPGHDGAVIHTARGFTGPDDPHPPHRPLNRSIRPNEIGSKGRSTGQWNGPMQGRQGQGKKAHPQDQMQIPKRII